MIASPGSELLVDRPDCTVRRLFVSDMNNAIYLLSAKSSGEQILIDAADDPDAIQVMIREGAADTGREGRLRFLVTTHAHWDHTRATAEVAERTGAMTVVGAEDAEQLREERGVEAGRIVGDGERIEIQGLSVDVIALRGHTPGSIAIALVGADSSPAILFTGDSLFPGGVGNTWDDPERFRLLLGDVVDRLFARFHDATRVFPGHGAGTTIGAERPALSEWEIRGW